MVELFFDFSDSPKDFKIVGINDQKWIKLAYPPYVDFVFLKQNKVKTLSHFGFAKLFLGFDVDKLTRLMIGNRNFCGYYLIDHQVQKSRCLALTEVENKDVWNKVALALDELSVEELRELPRPLVPVKETMNLEIRKKAFVTKEKSDKPKKSKWKK